MNGQDSYAALNYGDPAWALQAITGNPATDYSINPTNIATAWDSGDLIVLATDTPASSYIVGGHCLRRRRLQRVEQPSLLSCSTRGAPTLRGRAPGYDQ